MTLVWLIKFTLFFNTMSFAGTANDKECIEWMLSEYPELKKNTEYIPKHDLLIETISTPKGDVSIIHTAKGSVASVPHKSIMDCKPKRSVFGGREVKSISGFLNLAFSTKILGLYQEGHSPIGAISFLTKMPLACGKTSYLRLSKSIKATCSDLKKTPGASSLVESTMKICRGKVK